MDNMDGEWFPSSSSSSSSSGGGVDEDTLWSLRDEKALLVQISYLHGYKCIVRLSPPRKASGSLCEYVGCWWMDGWDRCGALWEGTPGQRRQTHITQARECQAR